MLISLLQFTSFDDRVCYVNPNTVAWIIENAANGGTYISIIGCNNDDVIWVKEDVNAVALALMSGKDVDQWRS